jgi:hypothetical protein
MSDCQAFGNDNLVQSILKRISEKFSQFLPHSFPGLMRKPKKKPPRELPGRTHEMNGINLLQILLLQQGLLLWSGELPSRQRQRG